MFTLALAGFACANVLQTPQSASQISEGATKVTFYNNGNSWVHTVVVFENIPKKDGKKTNIYADIWLKPSKNGIPGTASVDLSKLAGYGNQPLPKGTKIKMNIWGNLLGPNSGKTDNLKLKIANSPANDIQKPNIFVLPLPENIKNNQVKTTLDPRAGGKYLSNLVSNKNSFKNKPVTWNDAKSLTFNEIGKVKAADIQESVLCLAAGGGDEQSTVEDPDTIPMEKTGLPAALAAISALMITGGLVYGKLRK